MGEAHEPHEEIFVFSDTEKFLLKKRLSPVNRPYFNLSMRTDKFKEEFHANADWLKLSFHAKSEFPPKPYQARRRRNRASGL
ncbi:MAG: hypothetical protein IJX80_06105 [Clostridia bacterium]|nr:hypothetical protein [Clostridia bacterium]